MHPWGKTDGDIRLHNRWDCPVFLRSLYYTQFVRKMKICSEKIKKALESSDLSNFAIRPVEIAGDDCRLCFPIRMGGIWNKSNLCLRSCIYRAADFFPVSLSVFKFFNWFEQPDLAYTPFSLTANGGCQMISKIDGSTLIISKYKGELIARTRGTADAFMLGNGNEINLLRKKYPTAFNWTEDTLDFSLIFEWVTPNNKIVIEYGEVDMYLTGIIEHGPYRMMKQADLDLTAKQLGFKRPEVFSFDSVKEMLEEVSLFEGKEGVCVYCNRGQDIRKVKGEWYLALHRMKDELGSIKRVIDFYFVNGMPAYQEFYDLVCETLDFEIAESCKGDISRICDGMKEVGKITDYMKKFVKEVKETSVDRKSQALKILQAYGKTNRAGMVFSILDGKDISQNKDFIKKLLWQVLKK